MSFRLSERSLRRLAGVHPRLVALVREAAALSPVEFMVTEGLRTPERQAALVRAGASRTKRSRHLTGHAVDVAALVDGQVRWDWPLYEKLATAMKAAAKELNIGIEWGGDWTSLKDGPHFQLTWAAYP